MCQLAHSSKWEAARRARVRDRGMCQARTQLRGNYPWSPWLSSTISQVDMATSGDGCDGERADRPSQGGDHRRVPPPRRDRRPVGRLIYSSYAAPRIEQIELRGVRGNGALLRALSSGTTGTRTPAPGSPQWQEVRLPLYRVRPHGGLEDGRRYRRLRDAQVVTLCSARYLPLPEFLND